MGGWISGGMRCGSAVAVGTSFGPGKIWDDGIVSSLRVVDTLGTGSNVENVVTLGTSTWGCWRKRTDLGWGVEGGRGTGGCGWPGWLWMIAG